MGVIIVDIDMPSLPFADETPVVVTPGLLLPLGGRSGCGAKCCNIIGLSSIAPTSRAEKGKGFTLLLPFSSTLGIEYSGCAGGNGGDVINEEED